MNLYREREKIEQKALDFINRELYKNDDRSISVLSISLTKQDKEAYPDIYDNSISIFKALFNAGNKNYKIALWNEIAFMATRDDGFCEEDFSKEEYSFILSAQKARITDSYDENVNKPMLTNRLILRKISEEDCKILAYHYKNDGDFILFTGEKPTKRAILKYANRRWEMYFTMVSRETNKPVGYIGLYLIESESTAYIEYYVFKEYRRKGYCKEAINKIVDMTFKNKMYVPVETIWKYVYKRKAIKVNAIRVKVKIKNTGSIKTVESCGFIEEGILHKTLFETGSGWLDEKIYYITKEQ